MIAFFKKRGAPRMWEWFLAAVILLAVIAIIAPQQLPVVFYKLSLVTLAAIASYWLDKSLFRDVGSLREVYRAGAADAGLRALVGWRMLVRAMVFIGVVLGVTLGL